MKNLFLLLILCQMLGWTSCEEKTDYLNGKVKIVKPFEKEITLKGNQVILNDIYADYMTVYDSLILFSADFITHYVYIFNVFTGEKIGEYCPKGRGVDEYNDFTHTEQFVADADIKLWISGRHNSENLLNITRSLKEHREIYESGVSIDTKDISYYPFSFVFMLDSNRFLAKTQCQEFSIESNDYKPGSYKIYEGSAERLLKEFIIYNKPVLNKVRDVAPVARFYASRDRIKPDKTKLVMAMELLAQINILDLQKNTLQAFRLPDTPDFNYLTGDPQNFRCYYVDVCVDSDYIYALYADKGGDERYNNRNCRMVHVFDWNGTPKYKLNLSPVVTQIAIDPIHKKLYGKNDMEEIYVYNLKEVLSF